MAMTLKVMPMIMTNIFESRRKAWPPRLCSASRLAMRNIGQPTTGFGVTRGKTLSITNMEPGFGYLLATIDNMTIESLTTTKQITTPWERATKSSMWWWNDLTPQEDRELSSSVGLLLTRTKRVSAIHRVRS